MLESPAFASAMLREWHGEYVKSSAKYYPIKIEDLQNVIEYPLKIKHTLSDKLYISK